MLTEQIAVTILVTDALEALGVAYAIGGSFASAEDTVLAKLEWYRMGGEVSDRQWRDLLGVLEVQGDRLDRAYMRRMALSLGVADLLSRAFEETAWA